MLSVFLVIAISPRVNGFVVRPDLDQATVDHTPVYDCGTLALHSLLKLLGHPSDIRAVEDALPATPRHGHSMRNLRDAAQDLGVSLVGVRLSPNFHERIRDPILVFIRQSDHGHFVVVRSLGTNGSLLQVIDPSLDAPFVADTSMLLSGNTWTGLALIPERPHWPARIAGAVAVLSALSLIGMLVYPRIRRWARSPPPTAKSTARPATATY